MNECNKHPLTVPGYSGTHQQLAQAIGNMRYDQTAEVILYLSQDLARQAAADKERGRKNLAKRLDTAATKLRHAYNEMQRASKICEKHMPPPNASESSRELPVSPLEYDDGPHYEQ